MEKNMPLGVKILAVLGYIGAAMLVLAAIGFFIGGAFISSFIPEIGNLGNLIGISLGITMLVFAVIQFFIARGLWKGQNWARIVVIIFSILGFLGGIVALFTGDFSSIITLLINGFIIYYLGFVDEVKYAFK